MQDELGLNIYDYGNRNYDPTIGRFFNIDRYAEKYYNKSPYNYAANNPILFVDVKGDSIRVANVKDQAKVLKAINSQAVGTFAFDKKGNLYQSKKSCDATKYSQYYSDRLVAAIGDSETINIEIGSKVKEPGLAADGKTLIKGVDKEIDLETRRWGGGTTFGLSGTDQLTVVSENDWNINKDSFGKPLTQTFADKLMHELVAHAIPSIVGSDTGDGIKNENKVNQQLNKPLREELDHPE